MYHFVRFINTNVQSKMRTMHLVSFCLVLLSKKLVLFRENERPTNKLKSTNRLRDTNYGTLDLIDLIKYHTRLFIGSFNKDLFMENIVPFTCDKIRFSLWPKTLYYSKVYEIKSTININ